MMGFTSVELAARQLHVGLCRIAKLVMHKYHWIDSAGNAHQIRSWKRIRKMIREDVK